MLRVRNRRGVCAAISGFLRPRLPPREDFASRAAVSINHIAVYRCPRIMHCLGCAILILWAWVSASKASTAGLSQQRLQTTSEDKPPFDSDFNAFVEATLLEWHVPGLSIAVVDNGKTVSKVLFSLSHSRFFHFSPIIFTVRMLSREGLRVLDSTKHNGNGRYAVFHRQHNESVHCRCRCTIGA